MCEMGSVLEFFESGLEKIRCGWAERLALGPMAGCSALASELPQW